MIKNALVKHCAPTLAGIKTGNMFTVPNDSSDIIEEIRELNGMLTKKGLRLVPVRRTKTHTLIYLYRPERLGRDLTAPEAAEILSEKGYPCEKPECCLARLVQHLMNDDGFPHEIGLFLGYPPADVKGFMNSSSIGVKCIGCWKVYGNEAEAKRTFERYKKCTAAYCSESENGKPLEALVVDTRKRKSVQVAIEH